MNETILIDDEYFASLIKDIERAKHTIDLETYIFAADVAGKSIAAALSDAARRGVAVRVLVDGVGTLFWGDAMTRKMEEAGVQTRIFHPFPLRISHWGRAAHVPTTILKKIIYLFSALNRRNHRKICIIDKEIVYVSSANIVKGHLKKDAGGYGWRDTTVRLADINTDYLELSFERVWNHLPFKKRLEFRKIKAHNIFNFNYTWRQRRLFYFNLLNKIKNARNRVWITNAYFIPDRGLIRALKKAANRGVDVKIVLPERSDVIVTTLVATTFYEMLLKNKINIYEYKPSMLHAKTLIIDDYFTVGTTNLNSRSLRFDLEVDVNIQESNSKLKLEKQFLIDIKNSKLVDDAYLRKQFFMKKLLGKLLLSVKHWM